MSLLHMMPASKLLAPQKVSTIRGHRMSSISCAGQVVSRGASLPSYIHTPSVRRPHNLIFAITDGPLHVRLTISKRFVVDTYSTWSA